MSLPDRLSSLSSGSKEPKDIKEESPRKDEVVEPGSNCIQRCVIIQRDEKGYGLTVSGDNPVFVQSVKSEGAAARAGVQEGDKIVKVNGSLVLNRNHLDVVKLIKSGSYVVLTLVGKPPSSSSGATPASGSGTTSQLASTQRDVSQRDSTPSSNRVTAPKPVDPEKDRELWQQKVHYLRAMYETAKDDFEKLQRTYVKSPTERLHSQLIEKEKTLKTLENQLKALTGSAEPTSDLDPSSMESSTSPSWASSFPNPISDSDSPNTSPCGSPTPNHPENTSSMDVDEHVGPRVDAHPARHIISPEEDDFNSDDEPTTDHGPFQDITLLEKKPAHLAVFLHYLISNSDPSPVFFYIVSDVFSRAQGNAKELKKWAYEIYSTFLAVNAPLRVELDDVHINQIDTTLTTSSTKDKQDNEAALRGVFDQARCAIRMEIQDLLQDFRSKKELGLGNIYGAHELKDNMDKSSEMRTIEKVLSPHLENIMGKEEARRSDKEQATLWALATVFRQLGVNKLHSGVIDRVQSFVMKDKKSIKFPGTRFNRSKTHKGHQFNAQHYYMATFCYQCKGLIWGVGFQGFQCSSCEINVHKQCLEDVAECGGKKKGKRPSSMLPIVPSSRKPSNSSLHSVGPVSTSSEGSRESLAAAVGVGQGDLNITTQPYPKEIDSELAGTVNEHSVKSIVDRYEGSGDRKTRSSPPGQGEALETAAALVQKKGTDLGRSESMKGRGEKGDRPARRAKSDVDMDNAAFNTLNQSGSSSASSISNRGIDSPGNSYETVSELAEDSDMDVESELPTLKEVLGDEVVRKLKPKEKKRQEVINEFFHTEFCHMRNLKILQRVFFRPLVDIMGNRALGELLFPNIDKMIQLHQMLHTEMKNRRKENPVVQEVGDILLKRFDGHAGEDFKEGCARFCANQSHALDVLRKSQRKDYKLAQFLNEAESNPRCRRLQLKDLLPTQMQRLTKYPLLIENLLKYTQQNSDEHRNLEMAHLCSKKILEHVNQAIREHENKLRLEDLQRRMDKRPVESINDVSLEDIKGLDLTKGRLAHDGPLMWRLRSHRLLEVHVVLLEDMMVILQKSDDRLILKCHSTNQSSPDKFTHTPVLRLQNLLARNVATDKKSFFVVNTSETGPQIYELIANTQDERKKWCRLINDFAEKMKSGTKGARTFGYSPGMAKVSPPTNSMTHTGQAEEITVVRDTIKRETPRQSSPIMEPPGESESGDAEDVPSGTAQSGLLTAQPSIVPVHDNLIQPSELSVSDPIIAMAQPVRAPLERLRHLDDQIRVARHEREAVLADLGPEDYFQYQMTEPWGSEGDLPGGEAEMEEKLTQEMLEHSQELCRLLATTEASPDLSLPRESSESGAARAEDPRSPGGGSGAIPMSQLKDMASEMQQIIKNLMSVVGSSREERDRLRQELAIAQEKISRLREIQRSVNSGELPLSPASPQGVAPFAGLGGEGLLGASVEAGQGDDKRSSLIGVSDDDGDDSNASTATTETTSEQALESVTGDRPSTPDQGCEKLETANTSSGFSPSVGLQPGDDDRANDKSDESDSDTCKAGGPGGVAPHSLTEQLDSFSSFTSESTLLASSMMTTDLDEGPASPDAQPPPPQQQHAGDDNEDDNGDEDSASRPSTTTDCDLDPPSHAPAETDPSATEGRECSGAEAFEGKEEEESHGESVPAAEGSGEERDAGSAPTTDLDSSDHTEPVEI